MPGVYHQILQATAMNALSEAYFSTIGLLAASAAAGGAAASDPRMKATLQALRMDAIPRSWTEAMWEEIGASAQESLVESYRTRKLQRNVQYPQERTDRYANGALLRALQSDSMYRATSRGLYFIDTDVLDREARQWRRLNFGAGGGGPEGSMIPPKRFPVTGLGLMIGIEPDPRPAFRIPRGMWISQSGKRVGASQDAVGQDAFYPGTLGEGLDPTDAKSYSRTYRAGGSLGRAKMTRGIAARNFMDPPVRLIGRRIKPGLDALWDRVRDSNERTTIVRVKTGMSRLPR